MQDNTNEEAIATTSSTIDNAFTASRLEDNADNDNHTTNVKGKYHATSKKKTVILEILLRGHVAVK